MARHVEHEKSLGQAERLHRVELEEQVAQAGQVDRMPQTDRLAQGETAARAEHPAPPLHAVHVEPMERPEQVEPICRQVGKYQVKIILRLVRDAEAAQRVRERMLDYMLLHTLSPGTDEVSDGRRQPHAPALKAMPMAGHSPQLDRHHAAEHGGDEECKTADGPSLSGTGVHLLTQQTRCQGPDCPHLKRPRKGQQSPNQRGGARPEN